MMPLKSALISTFLLAAPATAFASIPDLHQGSTSRTEAPRANVQTAMARPLPYSQKHIDWCIRSHSGYRASDNTYPYDRNFRQECSSPYYKATNNRLRF